MKVYDYEALMTGTKLIIWSDKELQNDFLTFINQNKLTKNQIECVLEQMIGEVLAYGN